MGYNDTSSIEELGTGIDGRVSMAKGSFPAVSYNVTRDSVLHSVGSRDLRLK